MGSLLQMNRCTCHAATPRAVEVEVGSDEILFVVKHSGVSDIGKRSLHIDELTPFVCLFSVCVAWTPASLG